MSTIALKAFVFFYFFYFAVFNMTLLEEEKNIGEELMDAIWKAKREGGTEDKEESGGDGECIWI